MFRELDPAKIIETIARLRDRIRERFPSANLGNVADELLTVARAHAARSAAIRRPNRLLRAFSVLLLLAGVSSLVVLLESVRPRMDVEWRVSDAVQTVEAGLSVLFFLGVIAVYLLTLDHRRKRARCLQAVHEIRAMAHIVDMHQLTKDPDIVLHGRRDTKTSPDRRLTRFELTRYLDYCSEMLSLMGKVAALYVQRFPDGQAMTAVDDVEDLTTSLSRKIWQKIMILEQAGPEAEPTPGLAAPAPAPAPA